MMIAGEASGDMLCAELIRALRELSRARGEPDPLEFFGAGGAELAGAGAQIDLDLTAHAVVGLWEVIRNYGKFRKFFRQLLRLAIARQPEAIILIDYPGFNLRFASAIRRYTRERAGPFHNWRPKLIYYVSPQFWAWHESRVKKMAEDIDLLLSIFPFEPAWYQARAPGLAVEFVGHPVIDRYVSSRPEGASSPRPSPPLRRGEGEASDLSPGCPNSMGVGRW